MKPDWKDAPEWAQWLAMDADGEWWWYAIRPLRYSNHWGVGEGRVKPAQMGNGGSDWNESLEPRP